MIGERIAAIAREYIGQRERPGNGGFVDAKFEGLMRATGWERSQAWCAYFAEAVWKRAYADTPLWSVVDQLFSASATQTWRNFAETRAKRFATSSVPVVGAVAVWRYGSGWQGHVGIVVAVEGSTHFRAVEGNTNADGGREGIEVAERRRRINVGARGPGLNLLGFIHPA